MEGESVKNDIKTIFLITNTFNAMVSGLFPLSLIVAILLTEVIISPLIFLLPLTVSMVSLATLGYYAAVKENKKMLNTYSVMMGLLTVVEWVTTVVVLDCEEYITLFTAFHTSITLGTMTSAVLLGKRVHFDLESEPKSSRLSQCLKIFGCGFILVIITGYVVKVLV